MAAKNRPGEIVDIAVVGGGASGLAAAIAAARAGALVVVLEKLPRVGKKLLATGNGRCNLGNESQAPGAYHGSMETAAVFGRFQGEAAFFRTLGLYVRPDEEGRLYPVTGQAASVLDALRLMCRQLGVREVCDFPVCRVTPSGGCYQIESKAGITYRAHSVILATGGSAAPRFGTGGDGFDLARALGHAVTPLSPALAPIGVHPKAVGALKGLRVVANVTALQNGRVVRSEQGQVQFTERALSGICVFNLAAYRPDTLSLDLLPWCGDAGALLTEIFKTRENAPLEDFLTGLLPKRIGQALLKSVTDMPMTAPASALSAKAFSALAALLKDWQFDTVLETDWDSAQVTAGGVTGIGPTLESPILPGLFFAGELLDVHGDSGGYNLRWAWASGTLAGEMAGRRHDPH